jgi:arginine decarboxylase
MRSSQYAERDPARLHVPGHKGGQGADPACSRRSASGPQPRHPGADTYGIDVGVEPTPFERAQRLAAEAWGARRAWFLVNGASQGNLAVGPRARPPR